jgi:hypothetical protein
MAHNAMVVAVQFLYSPDLDPSDFSLFGHMKGLLRGESLETGEQSLSAVEGESSSLEKWTLTKLFLEWIKRAKSYIETDGDYVG